LQTRLPTPHPQAGSTWWYSTQAFVSAKWHPEEEQQQERGGGAPDRDDLVGSLDRAFFAALQGLLDWDSLGMSTQMVVGSKDIFDESEAGQGSASSSSSSSSSSGDIISGDIISGDIISGDIISGDIISGDIISGDIISGDIISGDGGSSVVSRGRKLKLAQWDSFTLGVWTTAAGSLQEVSDALDLIMTNQSLLLEYAAPVLLSSLSS
jgi:hypothetical protein